MRGCSKGTWKEELDAGVQGNEDRDHSESEAIEKLQDAG